MNEQFLSYLQRIKDNDLAIDVYSDTMPLDSNELEIPPENEPSSRVKTWYAINYAIKECKRRQKDCLTIYVSSDDWRIDFALNQYAPGWHITVNDFIEAYYDNGLANMRELLQLVTGGAS